MHCLKYFQGPALKHWPANPAQTPTTTRYTHTHNPGHLKLAGTRSSQTALINRHRFVVTFKGHVRKSWTIKAATYP